MYKQAVIDFLEGEGRGVPKSEHCKLLATQHKDIREFIAESMNNKVASISIMPYDNTILYVKNPVHLGCFTTTLYVSSNDHTMLIHFDRN